MKPRVLLLLVDGMRPDGLLAARAPRMHRLRDQGASTMSARTVMPSVTLPCHSSLFYGVNPDRHGITTNTWAPPARPTPSLIEVFHQRRLPTASFYNWEQLRDMSPAGTLNVAVCLNNCYDPDGDARLTDVAVPLLKTEPWVFAFVYLGYTDVAGHEKGWMTQAYFDGIEKADQCVGRLLDAVGPETFVVLMADHGGHEKTHGTDSPEDMTIPLILRGPGIGAGTTLRPDAKITDVAPTITKLMGIDPAREWIGTPLI